MNRVRAGALCVLGGLGMSYVFEAAALAVLAKSAADGQGELNFTPVVVLVILALLGWAVKLFGVALLGKETVRTIRAKGWRAVPKELWQIIRTGSS
ncbi:hypothetical protein [Streptomyces olivoreticuli]|uniref:hypothetical protein n=1 Tax=Streptomyces olivoreticuli TaxID=68246 RepID=UPI0013C2EE8D|nr:hypothetical protein [Streptomyces olivoreticuli]